MQDQNIRRLGWLLLLVTAAVYLPAVGAGFVWDDPQQIVGNLYTGELSNLGVIFSTDVWSTAGVVVENPPYYRPLLITSFAIDRALWGLSTAGAHLHSLAWHLAAVACVLALLRRLLPPIPALVGAALFALHPLQSEAVIWVSARNDPMTATFCVGAVLALLPERPGPRRLLAGGLLMLAGLLTKELALMTAALLVGLDIARFGRPRGWARYAAIGGALVVWAWLRARAGVGGSDALSVERLSKVMGEFVTVVGLYGKLFIWPWPLTVARRLGDLHESALAVATGWTVFLVGGAIWIRRGRGLALAGLVFAAVTFGPTLLGMGATHQVGERYLYLPMVGLGLALGSALPDRREALAALALVAVGWVTAIGARLPDWKSDLGLAASSVERYPSGSSYGALAQALRAEGEREQALGWYARALEADPPSNVVCVNAVDLAWRMGLPDEVVAMAERARAANCPPFPPVSGMEADALARIGDWAGAEAAAASIRGDAETRALWGPVLGAVALMERDEEAYRVAQREVAGVFSAAQFDEAVDRLVSTTP